MGYLGNFSETDIKCSSFKPADIPNTTSTALNANRPSVASNMLDETKEVTYVETNETDEQCRYNMSDYNISTGFKADGKGVAANMLDHTKEVTYVETNDTGNTNTASFDTVPFHKSFFYIMKDSNFGEKYNFKKDSLLKVDLYKKGKDQDLLNRCNAYRQIYANDVMKNKTHLENQN